MRFVAPETVRIELSDGAWIDIKKALTAGEEKSYRSAGFRRVSQQDGTGRNEVDVDWTAMAFARVEAYLLDWSAKKPDGKDMPVSRSAIRALSQESFDEIDEAIKARIEATDDEKKATTSGGTSSTASSS